MGGKRSRIPHKKGANNRGLSHTLNPRDLGYMKPRKFADYLTISELSRAVNKERSWLLVLEKEGRIPKAHRVTRGQIEVRLWSPAQVEEIRAILKTMRPGRKKGWNKK